MAERNKKPLTRRFEKKSSGMLIFLKYKFKALLKSNPMPERSPRRRKIWNIKSRILGISNSNILRKRKINAEEIPEWKRIPAK